MEVEMELEDDNSSSGDTAVEFTFTAVEIDIDYEFEAARFFDFTRTESIDEAREAEMWFESVGSYPPSPFAVRLLSREKGENANGSALSKGFDNSNQSDTASNRAPDDSTVALSNTDADVVNTLDLKSYYMQAFQKQHTSSIPKNNARIDSSKSKAKSSWKPSFPRTSTLMKPTASQLAKQNQERLVDHFRFQKFGNNSSGVESQAAKRQKLDGGHLFKVTDTTQQTNFIHKAPKREGIIDGNLGHGRLRITVPRPPDLATAQRAHRTRQKDDNENQHVTSRAPGFRARPLNRKIFEAPSLMHQKRTTRQLPEFQEFHLKTSERAVQNTASAVTSTLSCYSNLKAPQKPSLAFGTESSSRELKGSNISGVMKQEDGETIHRFKALPLNKKIFSSKGDLGVFRSSKRETTVAMAFNFQTEKRAHHAPPVDLFNKLSLASEPGSRSTRPPSMFTKGSKENRVCSFQQQSAVTIPKLGSKQANLAKTINEGPPLSIISRNLGTR
ncbi:protein TPX2-like [Bidens hawaiensis]|uniref:protein TPX2-like n=1 Tax=Bidens hawaiensis TaxID=980011 RepID=UPI00404A2ABE